MALFERVAQNGIFPEIGIWRSEVFRRAVPACVKLHWAFPWLFRVLAEGPVILREQPFYRFSLRTRHGSGHVGLEQAVSHLDAYRGGMEEALRLALRTVPVERKAEMTLRGREWVDRFMAVRLWNASRILGQLGRQREALEAYRRLACQVPDLDPVRLTELQAGALVETIGVFLRMADCTRIWVAPELKMEGLLRRLPGVELVAEAGADAVCLVAARGPGSVPPERILVLDDLLKAVCS
jgi:hypothetical protein